MNSCPPSDQLRLFLEERLDATARGRIEEHLAQCPGCLEAMGQINADYDSEWWRERLQAVESSPSFEDLGPSATMSFSGRDRTEQTVSVYVPGPAEAGTEGGWPTVKGYTILGELGRRGMGVVYKALDQHLGRQVALKMLHPNCQPSPEHLARFTIEARAVARLNHPHIIQIYETGEVGKGPGRAPGLPYVALELLGGGSLRDRLSGVPQLGRPAAELVVTLARAIQAAHEAGVLHRDLKPSNVLFAADGPLKVTDFGLAKLVEDDSHPSFSGQMLGTPSYMAPEQARGRVGETGPAADVYSLGAILYEMLTGRPPFRGPTALETVRMVVEEEPVAPSRLIPRVSRELETICLKCLTKEPSRRYASAALLADDLGRYLRGEPILARRISLPRRGLKWARRQPRVAAALLLGVLSIAGVSGGIAYANHREAGRLEGLRQESLNLLFEGQGLLARKDWNGGRLVLSRLLTRIEHEPKLADLRARASDMLGQIRQGLTEDQERDADQARFQLFIRLRNEAFFHETRFTGLDLPVKRDQTRQSARAALEEFATPGAGGTWDPRPPSRWLERKQEAEVIQGCHVLLLVLAGATPQPDQALTILDQAKRWPLDTRAYHQRRAACLEQLKDKAAASREREAAGSDVPATAFDHFLAGQESFKAGHPDEALRDFDAALRLQPDHFWAQCLSAVCFLQLQRPLEAKASLNACLNQDSDFAWLYLLRGFASGQMGAIYTKFDLASTQPNNPSQRARDQFTAAEDDYAQALEILDRKPAAELRYVLLVNRGVLRFQRGDRPRAEADLLAAVQLDGSLYNAHAELGRVLREDGKAEEAIAQYTEAVASRPDLPALYRGRAEVYLARNDLTPSQIDSALHNLAEAARREVPASPLRALDHLAEARLMERSGRHDAALVACDAALRVVVDNPDALRFRVGLLLKQKRYDEALRSCDALLKVRPTADIFELRATARYDQKDYAGAIGDYTQVLALHPDDTKLWCRRGWAYLFTGAMQLARDDFDRTIQLDPSNGDAYSGRGSARVMLAQYREAVADAETSLHQGNPSPLTFQLAGRIYARAALFAAAYVRKEGRLAVSRVEAYLDRAVVLIRESVRRTPASQRAGFVRDQLYSDKALKPILRRLKFDGMEGVDAVSTR